MKQIPKFTAKMVYGRKLYVAENKSAELLCKFVDPRRETLNHYHMRILKTLDIPFEILEPEIEKIA